MIISSIRLWGCHTLRPISRVRFVFSSHLSLSTPLPVLSNTEITIPANWGILCMDMICILQWLTLSIPKSRVLNKLTGRGYWGRVRVGDVLCWYHTFYRELSIIRQKKVRPLPLKSSSSLLRNNHWNCIIVIIYTNCWDNRFWIWWDQEAIYPNSTWKGLTNFSTHWLTNKMSFNLCIS